MIIEQIELHRGKPEGIAYEEIGPIRVRVGAAFIIAKTPTIEDANLKLREQASRVGADAVIDINYERGVSAGSWKALTATGTAVVFASSEKTCVMCGESIKSAARICRFCGSDATSITEDSEAEFQTRVGNAQALYERHGGYDGPSGARQLSEAFGFGIRPEPTPEQVWLTERTKELMSAHDLSWKMAWRQAVAELNRRP